MQVGPTTGVATTSVLGPAVSVTRLCEELLKDTECIKTMSKDSVALPYPLKPLILCDPHKVPGR